DRRARQAAAPLPRQAGGALFVLRRPLRRNPLHQPSARGAFSHADGCDIAAVLGAVRARGFRQRRQFPRGEAAKGDGTGVQGTGRKGAAAADACGSLMPAGLDDRLIVGLDVPTVEEAERTVGELGAAVSFYKIGYQLAFAGGLELARDL